MRLTDRKPQPEAESPHTPPRGAVFLRVFVFAFFSYVTLLLLSGALYAALGLLLASVVGAFSAAAMGNLLAMRIWERRPLADLGLHWSSGSGRNLFIGSALGAGAAVVLLGTALATNMAAFRPVPEDAGGWGTLAFLAIVMLFGSVGEELLFRGYGFQTMVAALGPWTALLPMGVLFAAAHSSNLSVSYIGLFNTFAWGVALGYAVLRSRDLWVAIGMHFGWNFTLPLFGVNVSGFKMGLTGYVLEWRVPPLWSGGDYGPEGGLLCTAVLVIMAYALGRVRMEHGHLPVAFAESAEQPVEVKNAAV